MSMTFRFSVKRCLKFGYFTFDLENIAGQGNYCKHPMFLCHQNFFFFFPHFRLNHRVMVIMIDGKFYRFSLR